MKHITALLTLCLCTPAWADTPSLARRCLDYGKAQMAQNRDVLARLNASRIDEQDVVINRYDGYVGRQPVATELLAALRDKQGVSGKMLCLLNDDTPLYVYIEPRA